MRCLCVTLSLLQLLVVERVRRARRRSELHRWGRSPPPLPLLSSPLSAPSCPLTSPASLRVCVLRRCCLASGSGYMEELVVNRERVLLRSSVAAACGLVPPRSSICVWPLLLRHRVLAEALWLGGNMDCAACAARRGVAPRARSHLVRFLVARSLFLLIQRC